jgi:hypothetical protein
VSIDMPSADPSNNIALEAALAWMRIGASVVPPRSNGSKAPIGSWERFMRTAADEQQIRAWYQDPTMTGVGVVCGAVSNNLELCEVEGRAVEAKLHITARELAINSGLEDLWDRITNGYCEQTPSGGIHWLYRVTDGLIPGNDKLASRSRAEVLAETRGEGGYCIVAPSAGTVHPSGKPWKIIVGSPATIANITMAERDAFLTCFRALDEMPTVELFSAPTKDDSIGTSPGDDFNTKSTWEELLVPKGWMKVFTDRAGVTYWRRPGKDAGISASTGREGKDNLYVFSTSTEFDAEKPYSKFAAYTLFNHHSITGEAFKLAATQLRRNGYGTIAKVMPIHAGTTGDDPASDTLEPTSWQPVDLAAILAGTHVPPKAEIFTRVDGIALLYPQRIHSFYGESESGKSWVVQKAVTDVLNDGGDVAYIDFESDAVDVIERLKLLGARPVGIAAHLRYIRPETPPQATDPAWVELLASPLRLVVIDGVTEALTIWGGESKDNDAITNWVRVFPRQLAKSTGAAVAMVDHIAKDKDTRGRFAIGGQAKLASIDGAAYLVEPLAALAPGRVGKLTIRITKDRPGGVRRHGGSWRKNDRTQEIAVVHFDATLLNAINFELRLPEIEIDAETLVEQKITTDIMHFLVKHGTSTKGEIEDGVKGRAELIRAHLEDMRISGHLISIGGAAANSSHEWSRLTGIRYSNAATVYAMNDDGRPLQIEPKLGDDNAE